MTPGSPDIRHEALSGIHSSEVTWSTRQRLEYAAPSTVRQPTPSRWRSPTPSQGRNRHLRHHIRYRGG